MKVCFLYEDKEWTNVTKYRDADNIIQDLGLKTLFSVSAKEIMYKGKEVVGLNQEDVFLAQTMKSVMMVPLTSEEELKYRQEMIHDALRNEEFILELYSCVEEMLKSWDALGRRAVGKGNARDSSGKMIYDIQVLKLFVNTLSTMKGRLKTEIGRFGAKGFKAFYQRLCEEFSDEKEAALRKLLGDIVFLPMTMKRIQETRQKQNLGLCWAVVCPKG